MSSKRHTCNCSDCVESRETRYELQHGGMDWEVDETELVPYRKKRRKHWGKRSNRPCAKSKTGEKCEFTVKKIYRTFNHYKTGENKTDYVMTCHRCGKHGHYIWSYQYSWLSRGI